MRPLTFFITGTDTGVGKTVVAGLLTRQLIRTGIPVAALKPICSGGRADARVLHAAQNGALALDEINPWHFRAPLAPLLAARGEGRKLTIGEVLFFVRRIQRKFPVVLVEGAGGLLSPLGEDFDSRDLIERLDAIPIVVCPNRLGAINQVRLVLAALPRRISERARVVLVAGERPDVASRTNPALLRESFPGQQIHILPRLKVPPAEDRPLTNAAVRRTLRSLAALPKSR